MRGETGGDGDTIPSSSPCPPTMTTSRSSREASSANQTGQPHLKRFPAKSACSRRAFDGDTRTIVLPTDIMGSMALVETQAVKTQVVKTNVVEPQVLETCVCYANSLDRVKYF